MTDRKKPEEISDDALDGAQGGAQRVHVELTANGADIQGASTDGDVVRNAGLRSDGELVQATKAKGDIVMKGSNVNQN